MNKSMSVNRQGFTLIELLIVIGILGILAAGLLAAIDPLDQLRKGRDSSKRSISSEILNGINRYYVSRGTMPWNTGVYGPTAVTNAGGTALIGSLVAANELKSTFLNGIPTAGNPLYIYSDASNNLFCCVQQEAKAINENAIYIGNNGTTGASCVGGTGTTACWYCAR